MVTIRVNVYEVKAKLSKYLDRAVRGERIVICRHNRPVAELRPVAETRAEPRPIGPLAGRPTFELPAAFFEPLSSDELDLWEGLAPTDPVLYDTSRRDRAVTRVSERAVSAATPPRRVTYRPSPGAKSRTRKSRGRP